MSAPENGALTLTDFRAQFRQTTEHGIYIDNASMGPVSPAVTQAMADCMQLRQTMPMAYYRYADQVFPRCRALLSQLTGAAPQDIAFTENVAYGINAAAGSLPLEQGDNVILCSREFASNVYPWLRLERAKGVEARIVPHADGGLTTDLLNRYADRHTRVVSVSSAQFADGCAADLEAIGQWCHSRGAFLVVDCAQSLGVIPMDVKRFQIDFLAGLSSKWLLGPFATGFLYVNPALSSRLLPAFVGADSVKGDVDSVEYQLDLKEGAARFELGLPNAPGIAGLAASLSLMEQVGFAAIRAEAWRVSGYFIERLRALGVELAPCARQDATRSAIVSFTVPGLEEAHRYLRENRIFCSLRCGYLRTGLHAYNTTDEVDEVISVLGSWLKRI